MATNSLDLVALEQMARSAQPGPWQWFGNTKTYEVYLATVHGGRIYVLDFARWGMGGGQPRFNFGGIMHSLGELGKTDHPSGPKFEVPYRRQFVGIGHPDATYIAGSSPDVMLSLIARIRELEAALVSAGSPAAR